jgi:endonuclease/exonuclease/phosphatase (EEP) superfamily protein YafD
MGLLGSLISLGSLLSSYNRYFDLLSHFRIQYIALIAVVLCIALFSKRYKSAAFLCLCMGIHAFDVARSQNKPEFDTEADGPVLRVMSSNLLANNTDYDLHVQFIKSVDPDIIVFQEYTFAWQAALSPALEAYRYKVEVAANHAFGNALYSKNPLNDIGTPALLNASRKSVEGTVAIDGTTLKIFGTHTLPPMSQQLYEDRNLHLQILGDKARAYSSPMLVMGDLNISPWSNHFRNFVENGRLHDGRRQQGVLPTWPTNISPLQIPIDHILHNSGVRVLSMHTSTGLKSDHKVVWADIKIVGQ